MTATVEAPPMLTFEVEVAGIAELSPNFRRITFTGERLAQFSRGPVDERGIRSTLDLRIKLMVPSLGHPLPRFGTLAQGWYQQWLAMDPETRGHMRTYTVRNARLDGPEAEAYGPQIDVDFVIHLDADGNGGPASNWASKAKVGDRLTIIGPNELNGSCPGIEWRPPAMARGAAAGYVDELHPHTRRVLLAGDETALPAISCILESLPADFTGNAYVEVPDADDFVDIDTASGVEITWLARNGRPHGEALDAAVRGGRGLLSTAGMNHRGEEPEDVDIDEVILWDTPTTAAQRAEAAPAVSPARDSPNEHAESTNFYAWIAGEAGTVKELRRYLVRDLGVDRRRVAFMGYWRRGKSEGI
ncbi:siderophore-interacting protein [Arthrobacter monumenti]